MNLILTRTSFQHKVPVCGLWGEHHLLAWACAGLSVRQAEKHSVRLDTVVSEGLTGSEVDWDDSNKGALHIRTQARGDGTFDMATN